MVHMADTAMKSDAEIQLDVIRELMWDSRVDQTDIGVEVDFGVVTLTGTVDSYAVRVAAQQAAHRVAGVLDVANNIQVRSPAIDERTDTDIALAVRRALDWDVYVVGNRIQSTVSNGWVTLEGEVDFLSERADAERAVDRLAGVRGVTNLISVHHAKVPPATVQESIQAALERLAKRQAQRIDVIVDGGVATLRGKVHSWHEKQAVLESASHAPGIASVRDELRIDPSL